MTEWKDCTTYARGDSDRTPTTFLWCFGGLRIVVTCSHIHYPGVWILRCAAVGIDIKQMDSKTEADAKDDAIGYVRSTLLGYVQELDRVDEGVSND